MIDHRFFPKNPPVSLKTLCALCGGQLDPSIDSDLLVEEIAPLHEAGANTLSFFDNRKYLNALRTTKAMAVLCRAKDAPDVPKTTIPIITETPYRAFALVVQAFYPESQSTGVHAPSAVIAPDAQIGEGTQIDPNAVIGDGVRLGKNVIIGANSVIAPHVEIGDQTHIGAGVSIEYALIGTDCRIHTGARIGTRGFGFAIAEQGVDLGHTELPQLGRVVIGNHVEIGANTTIDRGMSEDTQIGDYCRLDNLVQIAHNVVLGKGCAIAAQVGISGSTKLGDYVVMGGQSAIAGHLTIGDRVMIAGKSGVTKDMAGGQILGGFPAVPIQQWRRQQAILKKQSRRS